MIKSKYKRFLILVLFFVMGVIIFNLNIFFNKITYEKEYNLKNLSPSIREIVILDADCCKDTMIFVIENYFYKDNIKIFLDNQIIFNKNVTSNESTGYTSEFVAIKRTKKIKKLKIIFNNRQTLETEINFKYKRARVRYEFFSLRLIYTNNPPIYD